MTTPETVPVTDEDRRVFDDANMEWAMGDENIGAEIIARHRIASIEAACRDKDAEIARLQAANIDIGYDLRRVKAERDHLRTKLDDATRVQDVFAAALDIADRLIERGYGLDTPEEWHKAFRSAANARAAAPAPLVSKEQAIKLAEMEGDAEIGAGMPDHPLPQPEQKAQGDGAEPVAWQYRYRPAGTKVWSDWGDGKAPDMRGGSYETEERPLYAHPPAPKGQSDE